MSLKVDPVRYDLFGPKFIRPNCCISTCEVENQYAFECNDTALRINRLAQLYFDPRFHSHCLNENGSINEGAFANLRRMAEMYEKPEKAEGFSKLKIVNFTPETKEEVRSEISLR